MNVAEGKTSFSSVSPEILTLDGGCKDSVLSIPGTSVVQEISLPGPDCDKYVSCKVDLPAPVRPSMSMSARSLSNNWLCRVLDFSMPAAMSLSRISERMM